MRIALPMPSDASLSRWGVTREQWEDWTTRDRWEPRHTYAEAAEDPWVSYTLADAVAEFGVPVPMEAVRRTNVRPRRMDPEALREACAFSGMPSNEVMNPACEADVLRASRMAEQGQGLYVWGLHGRGKTFRACQIAKGWAEIGMAFRFTSSLRLLEDLRSCYDGHEREADVMGSYASTPLLVLDDLGKEVPTAWAASKIFDLIDRRCCAQLPTIYTSQFDPTRMAAAICVSDAELGRAIASRISGSCSVLHVVGDDMRQRRTA